MSIEKFNPRIYGETVPYSQVNTKVIQEIRSLEAGFVWVYLLTLPPNWKVVKEHIKSHFGIGKEKLKQIFAYLKRHNLIEYVQNKTSDGKFGKFDICVLNGSAFIREPVQTGGPENRWPVEPVGGESPTTNNIDIQSKQKNKENILCSSDDERICSIGYFDDFWDIYPRKQKKKESEKIWKRCKFDEIGKLIVSNVKQRIKTEWAGIEKRFIPLASSFLNGERFKDEVLNRQLIKKKEGLTVTEAIKFCLN